MKMSSLLLTIKNWSDNSDIQKHRLFHLICCSLFSIATEIMYSLKNTFMEFFLAGFNLEHCQVLWQLGRVYSQAMKRVCAGCGSRLKSIPDVRPVRRHYVGEQSVDPEILPRVLPVYPKINHSIPQCRDDDPARPRHHEP